MVRQPSAAVAAAMVACLAAGAYADPSYSLSIVPSSSQVAPGGSVDLNVFLVETGGPSILGEGLAFISIEVSRQTAPSVTEPASIDDSTWTWNSQFDPEGDQDLYVEPNGASALVEILDDTDPGPTVSGGQIYLFSLTAIAGTVAGETTQFNVAVENGILYYPFLDELTNVASGSTTLTVIPEPATLLLAAAGLLLMRSGRRRSGR